MFNRHTHMCVCVDLKIQGLVVYVYVYMKYLNLTVVEKLDGLRIARTCVRIYVWDKPTNSWTRDRRFQS